MNVINNIKKSLETMLLVHTKFFNIVNAFTDNYGKLYAIMTRAAVNSNRQWNSKHWLYFFYCS